MGFGEAVKTCLSKYATFSGRARRSEFWWFYLFTLIVSLVASLIDFFLGWNVTEYVGTEGSVTVANTGFPWAQTIASLALILPWISVSVRRLHDRDASGWWWWLNVLCCIGPLILLFVYWIKPGTPGPNKYGEDPKTSPAV